MVFCAISLLLSGCATLRDPSLKPADNELQAGLQELKNGRVNEAESNFNRALDHYKSAFVYDHLGYAWTYYGLGRVRYERAQFGNAEEYFRLALKEHAQVQPGDHNGIASVYVDLAAILSAKNDTEEAMGTFRLALENFDKAINPDPTGVGRTRLGMGGLYIRNRDYGSAEKEFSLAINEFENIKDVSPRYPALGYQGMGESYIRRNDLPNAEKNFLRAAEYFLKDKGTDQTRLAKTYHFLAIIYNAAKNRVLTLEYIDLALDAYTRARETFLKIGNQQEAEAAGKAITELMTAKKNL
ncbi:MAG TPA: tetratricopeptide repeat protein [Spirochaetia bacterium]|nr:tetratricopeptide repeat protein [Spirochaetia bacterium]